ncbi:MAG: MFS transporter, partial [Pseudonocardia sp.]|nr:MFS transporter [Pseudonocardia sp.]
LVGPVLVGGVADALGYRASLLLPAAALLLAAFLAPALRSSSVR